MFSYSCIQIIYITDICSDKKQSSPDGSPLRCGYRSQPLDHNCFINASAVENGKIKNTAGVYNSKVLVERNVRRIISANLKQDQELESRKVDKDVDLKSAYQPFTKEREESSRKVQDIQEKYALQLSKELQITAVKKEQTKKKQMKQLEHSDNTFNEKRHHRSKTQHLTKNFAKYESCRYGLPKKSATKTNSSPKSKRKCKPSSDRMYHTRESKFEKKAAGNIEAVDNKGRYLMIPVACNLAQVIRDKRVTKIH